MVVLDFLLKVWKWNFKTSSFVFLKDKDVIQKHKGRRNFCKSIDVQIFHLLCERLIFISHACDVVVVVNVECM
jgi:hypothetical protein